MPPADVLMSLAFGVLAFLVTAGLARVLRVASVRRQHETANERLVERLQQLVRAKNDVLLLELEVAELAEQATPSDRAWWAVRMREMAASVPPMLLEQARRFKLALPPPEAPAAREGAILSPELRSQVSEAYRVHAYEPDEAEPDDPMSHVQIVPNPWTGRR